MRIITRLNIGGPAIQAILLTERLDPSRFETWLVTGSLERHEGDMRQLRRSGSAIRTIELPWLGRQIAPIRDVLVLVQMLTLMRRVRPDVVHTHLSKAGSIGRLAAWLARVPIVVHTFHGNVLSGYFGSRRTSLFVMIERALARITTRLIAISPAQRHELLLYGVGREDRIVEIPLGLDLEPFRDPPQGTLRAELGVTPDRPLIGIVARLVPIKAVDMFLRCAAQILRDLPTAVFVIVGDGELRQQLEDQARALGLTRSVRWLGWRRDLPDIYADLDVLALSSRNEGTPVSVIEAMASGCAVVATDVGGTADLVGDAAVLVPSNDQDAMADAILGLLRDPVRRHTLTRRGRERAYARHDAGLLLSRVEALYVALTEATRTER